MATGGNGGPPEGYDEWLNARRERNPWEGENAMFTRPSWENETVADFEDWRDADTGNDPWDAENAFLTRPYAQMQQQLNLDVALDVLNNRPPSQDASPQSSGGRGIQGQNQSRMSADAAQNNAAPPQASGPSRNWNPQVPSGGGNFRPNRLSATTGQPSRQLPTQGRGGGAGAGMSHNQSNNRGASGANHAPNYQQPNSAARGGAYPKTRRPAPRQEQFLQSNQNSDRDGQQRRHSAPRPRPKVLTKMEGMRPSDFDEAELRRENRGIDMKDVEELFGDFAKNFARLQELASTCRPEPDKVRERVEWLIKCTDTVCAVCRLAADTNLISAKLFEKLAKEYYIRKPQGYLRAVWRAVHSFYDVRRGGDGVLVLHKKGTPYFDYYQIELGARLEELPFVDTNLYSAFLVLYPRSQYRALYKARIPARNRLFTARRN